MLGLVTEPARESATHASRENIDPINLFQRIMHEFPTTGNDALVRLAANLAQVEATMAPVEPEAPAEIAGDIPVHRDPVEFNLSSSG